MSHRIAAAATVAALGAATADIARADYYARWDRVGGGWSSGTGRMTGNANVCLHTHPGCRCENRNFCGRYAHGQIATWCPRGPNRGPVWQIRCTVRPISSMPGTPPVQRLSYPGQGGAVLDFRAP